MNSIWETIATIKTKVENALGMSEATVVPFESQKPHKIADKDSLRWSQAWFDQWDDERQRNVLVANIARDDGGYWRAIGFSHHPVNATFGTLPATINTVPLAERNNFLNTPETLRHYKPRFDWQD
jgi:hypothetical protein